MPDHWPVSSHHLTGVLIRHVYLVLPLYSHCISILHLWLTALVVVDLLLYIVTNYQI